MLSKAKQKAQSAALSIFDSDDARAAVADPFSMDNRAQGASRAVNLVVALVVGGLMAAFLLPIAIDEIASVDTSSWTNGAGSLWEILPVMIVLAIFLFFVGMALSKSNV